MKKTTKKKPVVAEEGLDELVWPPEGLASGAIVSGTFISRSGVHRQEFHAPYYWQTQTTHFSTDWVSEMEAK